MPDRKILVVAAAFVGILLGGAVSYGLNIEDQRAQAYCGEIEQGIQENMSEGFVNCFPPGDYQVNLSERVEKGSEVECICRKKVGDIVQELRFARSS